MRTLAAIALCLPLFAQEEPKVPTLAIGSPAVDFDLPGVDGRNWALKDFKDAKLLLVIFDTVHCPTSQAYGERIARVREDYQGKGLALVAISPSHPGAVRMDELGYSDLDDTFESMKLRAKHLSIPYPFLYDGEPNRVSQAYGPKTTPHCFLFDADRKLRYTGRIDDSEKPEKSKTRELRDAIEALLAGKEPAVTVTRPSGCSTKWPFKQDSVRKYNDKVAAEPVTVEAADAGALQALRRNDTGKVRLIHVWSKDDASQLKAVSTMNQWYRRRAFQFATACVGAVGEKEAALAALKGFFPPASGKNLLVADAKGLEADGPLPLTLVVNGANEVVYRASGPVDELECRRAIVKHLKADR